METQHFIEKYLIEEIQLMKAANVRLHLLASILHGIETAGAFLDDKPFKAKGQGRKRFSLALKRLFPKTYVAANQQLDLYGQLRSHMSHCMIPAQSVRFNATEEEHLTFDEDRLSISLEQLSIDYLKAMEALQKLDGDGALKKKRIGADALDFR